MEEQFNISAEADGQKFKVVFNATSPEVAVASLVYIVENASAFFDQLEQELEDAANEE